MKQVPCETENCIPILSSCVIWNGGENTFLDVCDGISINNVIWQISNKLETFSIEDIASFDIDALVGICGKQAPVTVTTLSVLNAIKDNEICIKDFIDELSQQIVDLSNASTPDINLKCFLQTDNQGNNLSITRNSLDQLFVDNLCSDKLRIESLESAITQIQSEIANFENTVSVDELSFSTCIDPGSKPTSSQVISIANELCDIEAALGVSDDISVALGNTPGDLNTEFGAIPGWLATPINLAQNYGNLLLEVENIRQRLISIETNCCDVSCKDVELGFNVIFNEDKTGLIIRFTSGAGTNLPADFTDEGSTGTIKDKNGNVEDFTLTISNGYETEVSIVGLDLTGDLVVSITAVIGNDAVTCEKCLSKTIKTTGICDFCTVCVSGTTGTVVVIYDDSGGSIAFESFNPETTTTTTTGAPTTTTTTTVGL